MCKVRGKVCVCTSNVLVTLQPLALPHTVELIMRAH
jgi:hypothetical protein